ncbi:hypothetical protein ACLKA6_017892 [Drosophila palustris]
MKQSLGFAHPRRGHHRWHRCIFIRCMQRHASNSIVVSIAADVDVDVNVDVDVDVDMMRADEGAADFM